MELVSPTSRRLLATGVPCEVSRFAPDLIHLGVADDRLLSAVVRICAGRLKVLYARTALIESLEIKGGCIEPPTGTPPPAARTSADPDFGAPVRRSTT